MRRFFLLFYLIIIKRLDNINRLLAFAGARYKDKILFVDPHNGKHATFKQFKENADRILTYLQKKGLKPQEVIAFYSSNYRRYFEVRAAAHLGNYIFFALSPGLSPDDVFYFLKESKAVVFFYNNFPIDKFSAEITNPVPIDSGLFKDVLDSKPLPVFTDGRPGDIATYNLSSGTTGRMPKIVPLTNKNWVSSFYAYIKNSQSKPSRKFVFLSCISLATAGSATFLPLLSMGATVIIYRGGTFKSELVSEYIKRYKITQLYLTPSWFLEFFEFCRQRQDKMAELDNIIVGTEPIPRRRLEEAILFFGPKISIGYGMVEVLPPVTLLSNREYIKGSGKIRGELLGSVGRVLKGVTIKIVDKQRWELGPNEVGVVAIKSKTRGRNVLNS
jgi:acyl-CoA synthetase (AMP-forming)/AMP-acid ligase II